MHHTSLTSRVEQHRQPKFGLQSSANPKIILSQRSRIISVKFGSQTDNFHCSLGKAFGSKVHILHFFSETCAFSVKRANFLWNAWIFCVNFNLVNGQKIGKFWAKTVILGRVVVQEKKNPLDLAELESGTTAYENWCERYDDKQLRTHQEKPAFDETTTTIL